MRRCAIPDGGPQSTGCARAAAPRRVWFSHYAVLQSHNPLIHSGPMESAGAMHSTKTESKAS